MFGLTLGAVWVYLRGERFSESTLSNDLAYFSAAFGVTTVIASAVQMTLTPLSGATVTTGLIWLELAICLSVPFFFSGVVVSLALTRSPYPIGRVYAVDLVGAATGCLGVLVLLNFTDGPSAIIWVASVALFSSILFAKSGLGTKPKSQPKFAKILGKRKALLFVVVLIALGNGMDRNQIGLRPIFVKNVIEPLELGPKLLFEEWNSYSRIIVSKVESTRPFMWGPSPIIPWGKFRVEQLAMNIDGLAGTYMYGIGGDPTQADFLKYDVTNLAYHLPNVNNAAVIGIGGGRDMLSAKVFGVPDVLGVEINPIFVNLLTDNEEFRDFVGLNSVDGLRFEIDEARSWFARNTDQFDIIQMSLIDTFAATGAGAFTLTENGLYTVEAWQIFLDRLSQNGVFTVCRWISPDHVNESGRMLSLAVASLLAQGRDDPASHIFLASSRAVTALLISRSPFSDEALSQLIDISAEYKFNVLASPNTEPDSIVLKDILSAKTKSELLKNTSGLEFDLSPPYDDRPFFFNQLPLSQAGRLIFDGLTGKFPEPKGVVLTGNLYATVTLVILFFVSLVLVAAAILVPLQPAIRDIGRELAIGGTAYFFLIGVGFMLIEIGLLQRLSVFLGHPIYSLSIVLFTMILATGLGSLISDKLVIDTHSKMIGWTLLTAGYLLSLTFWMPNLLLSNDSSVLIMRALVCISLVAPAGVLMGFGFPTGMRWISAVNRTPTPWFWGINGAAGVLSASLAVACSIAYGINTTLVLGAFCYLLLIPAAWIIGVPKTVTNLA